MAKPKLALQKTGKGQVSACLAETVAAQSYNTMGVAVAFASVAGVTKLLESILSQRVPYRSYWLFGLDNCITHPDAIERVMRLNGAKVRVVSNEEGLGIFHPKIYWFSDNGSKSALVLGSANLTLGGLNGNVEAVAAFESDRKPQSDALNAVWNATWRLGSRVTKSVLDEYRIRFDSARKARKKAGLLAKPDASSRQRKNRPVLSSDDARIDPALAKTCWIEVGKITGFKQDQLEIKAEQALFFGLPSTQGTATTIAVRLVSGATVDIPVGYFGNHMWRFQLPQAIPEVRKGIRIRRGGRLLRSDYVAVFERNKNTIHLNFIKFSSTKFKALRKATSEAGTLGRTTAREYGWV